MIDKIHLNKVLSAKVNASFGQFIRLRRICLEMSQKRLAEKSGLPKKLISLMERDKMLEEVELSVLNKLFEALEFSMRYPADAQDEKETTN